MSLVVDVCAASLADATTYMEKTFESDAFAASKPPKLNELLTPPQRKAYPFLDNTEEEEAKKRAKEAEKEAKEDAKKAEKEQMAAAKKVVAEQMAAAKKVVAERKKQMAAAKMAKRANKYTRLLRAWAPIEPVQGMRHGLVQARATEGHLQGMQHGPVRARAPEGQVQGLRHGPVRARAPEGQVQGLRHGPVRAQALEGALQGLQCTGNRQYV
jgi:hypothetical protein